MLIGRMRVQFDPTPKPRSIASRCTEAAESLGLKVKTLAYTGSAQRFLYKGDDQVIMVTCWESLLHLLKRLGAEIPPEYWEAIE